MSVDVNYTGTPGLKLHAGRLAAVSATRWEGDWINMGDSLTDPLYNINSIVVGMGRTLYPPRFVWNGGKSSMGVGYVADQLPLMHAAFPWVTNFTVRIGTNLGPVNTDQADFNRIISYAQANGLRICFLQIPPKGAGTPGVDAPNKLMNAWLKGRVDANPSFLYFIADSEALAIDANYNVNTAYAPDGTHQNVAGIELQAEDQRLPLLNILPNVSPLITNGSDIYPANAASDQWVQNPLMLGGSANTFPTNWAWESFGANVTYTPSAFVDPDGTRWMRMYVTNATAGYGTIKTQLLHPAINADMATIKRFDCLIEMRRTNVDAARVGGASMVLWTSGNQLASLTSAIATTPASGVFTRREVLRVSNQRNQDQQNKTLVPAAVVANSLTMRIRLDFTGVAGAGDVGIFDFRCASVRGSMT